MAIRDLLWACPECGAEHGLQPVRRVEACTVCGTRFRRGAGALIEAYRPGQAPVALPPSAWVDRLPDMAAVKLENAQPDGEPLHSERVLVRFAVGEATVRRGGVYLNRIERFGPRRAGTLVLELDRLAFSADDGGDGQLWEFDRLTAVQPSSSALQIKGRGLPVASLRFPHGSARFWEELISAALRRYYRLTRGREIVSFQPRIVTR